MSNFDQYVVTLPKTKGGPLNAELRSNWDQLGDRERTLTMVQMRKALRIIGQKGNPAFVTLRRGQNEAAYDAVMSFLETSTQHVEKFERQAAVRKQDRANRKLVSRARTVLESILN